MSEDPFNLVKALCKTHKLDIEWNWTELSHKVVLVMQYQNAATGVPYDLTHFVFAN
jgi:hypothetical protein